jgi:SAM-dependent methyltransferase
VLEHVNDDRRALAEIRRVVGKSGWALISVPINLDEETQEDTSITDPEEQKRRFGEAGHVRIYGGDLRDRLDQAGFDVDLHSADDLDDEICAHYGLRKDEHLFHCTPRSH